MIQQAKFTYLVLVKLLKNKIKIIEDQGEKQNKAIQNQGQVKTILKYAYEDDDSPLISNANEISNKLADKRLNEITKSDQKVTVMI